MNSAVAKRFDELKATGLLPSPTGVAMEILRLTQCDKSTAGQIAQTIQADPTLAGRTLKYANSSHAGARRPVAAISEAVVRLGMRTVGTLALGFSVLSSSRKGCCSEFDYDRFWSKSLLLGIGSKALCRPTRAAPEEEGFACGLLSQIGRLALASVYPEQYAEVLSSWNHGTEQELARQEQQAFGTDHNELTGAMLADWGLPESFQKAVMLEGDWANTGEDQSREAKLCGVLEVADRLAEVCLAEDDQRDELLRQLIEGYERLRMDPADLAGICGEVIEQWQSWGEILSVSTREVPDFGEMLEGSKRRQEEESQSSPPAESDDRPSESDEAVSFEPKSLDILVAEDDSLQQKLISKLIADAGHRVITASDGREGLRLALETNPDVVITDWMMPEMDGFELCRALRQTKFGRQLYLIIMTSDAEEERLVDAFEAGADDYLVKPLRPRPLQARIRAAIRMIGLQREVEQEREQIRKMTAELAVANRKLEEAAFTDALTSLPNRRFFIQRLKQEWARLTRNGGELSCILLDIDRFKSVNDTYGHDVGDEVLKKVATTLGAEARESDVLCRHGGEEFIVLCPDSDLAGAARGAERLRASVERETSGAFKQFDNSITVSLGVSTYRAGMQDEDQLIKLADDALYRAKQSGRNQVCCDGEQPAEMVSKIQDTLKSLFS